MANPSFAFGTLKFKNPNLNDLITFVFYFNKTQSQYDYDTSINELDTNNYNETATYIRTHHKINDNLYEIEVSFSGNGNSHYIHNLDYYFNLENYKSEINKISNYKSIIEDTSIEANFIDEDPEYEDLYSHHTILTATLDNNDQISLNFNDVSHTNYEYTASNLKDICDYTDVYSVADAIKNPDDYFTTAALINHNDEIMTALKSLPNPEKVYWNFDEFADIINIDDKFFL